jgi:predicted membrane GTPase involved in stress response
MDVGLESEKEQVRMNYEIKSQSLIIYLSDYLEVVVGVG